MHSFSDSSALTNIATTSNCSSSPLSTLSIGSLSSSLQYSTASYGSRTTSSVCSDLGSHNVLSSDSSGCTSIGSSPVPSDQGLIISPVYQNNSQREDSFSPVGEILNSEIGFIINFSQNDATFQNLNQQNYVNQKSTSSKRPLSSFSNNKSCDRAKEKPHRNQTTTSTRKMAKPDSFKTVMCKGWLEMGGCGFGQNCRFAHGEEELRPSKIPVDNPKYKTKLCDKYTRTGVCPYGDRCLFIHPETADSNGLSNPYIHPDRMIQIMKERAFPPIALKRNPNLGDPLTSLKPLPSLGTNWPVKLSKQNKSMEVALGTAELNVASSCESKESDRPRTLSDITNNDLSVLALSSTTDNMFSSSKASSDSGTELDMDPIWGITAEIADPFDFAIQSDNIARSLAIEFAKTI